MIGCLIMAMIGFALSQGVLKYKEETRFKESLSIENIRGMHIKEKKSRRRNK